MDIEKNLDYNGRRVVEQLQQVLNLRTNFLKDDKNVTDLFTHYAKALQVSDNVNQSIGNSKGCYVDLKKVKTALASLTKGNAESFLVINFKAETHMFSSVIRKTEDGYSITTVNRAAKHMYKEYVFDETNVSALAKILETSQDRLDIHSISHRLERESQKNYLLNVTSLHQKGLNCFLKEPESAIKYAVTTSSLSMETLKDFRKVQGSGFSVFAKKNATYRPKWPNLKTVEAHEKYYKEVAEKNPSIQPELATLFDIYRQNKMFRKALNQGMSTEEAFEKAFHHSDVAKAGDNDAASKYYNISIETAIKRQKDVVKMLKNDKKNASASALNVTIDVFKQIINLKDSDKTYEQKFLASQALLKKHADKIKEVEKNFPFLSYQIKGDICAHLFGYANKAYALNRNHKEVIERISFAIQVYPKLPDYYVVRGDIYRKIGHMQKAIEDYQKVLQLNPNDTYAQKCLKECKKLTKS